MTLERSARDGEIEALVVDRYLESLLARTPRDPSDIPADLRATADALAALPRYHPSFRFVEALSARLAATASATDTPADVLDFPAIAMDSHLFTGYDVPPYYDSLLGKLIVWGPDRATAIARGRVALEELVVDGITTNVDIHQALLASETFLEGRMTTNLLDRVGSAAFLAAAARV